MAIRFYNNTSFNFYKNKRRIITVKFTAIRSKSENNYIRASNNNSEIYGDKIEV